MRSSRLEVLLRSVVTPAGINISLLMTFLAIIAWIVVIVGATVVLIIGRIYAGFVLLSVDVLLTIGIVVTISNRSYRDRKIKEEAEGHKHDWYPWINPLSRNMVKFDTDGTKLYEFVEYFQRRSCKTCGEVEERIV